MHKDETQKRQELKKILKELAFSEVELKDDNKLESIYSRLENMYWNDENSENNGFRHFYSDIFSTLSEIKTNPALGNIDVVGSNLSLIRERYNAKNKDKNEKLIDVSENIKKLFDHVNLDIARLNYQDSRLLQREIVDEFNKKTSEANTKIENLEENINNISNEVENAKSEMKSLQREYITILGIFAAIVMAFTGGLAFSTSVLQFMDTASIYRIVLVVDMLAVVLLAVINMLVGFIAKINNQKEIHGIEMKTVFLIAIAVAIITSLLWAIDLETLKEFLHNKFSNT